MPRTLGPIGLTLSLCVILLLTLLFFAAPLVAAALLDLAFDHGVRLRAALDGLRTLMGGGAHGPLTSLLFVGIYSYVALGAATLCVAAFRGRADWRLLVAWTPWSVRRAGLRYWTLVAVGFFYGAAASVALGLISPKTTDLSAFPRRGVGLAAAYLLAAAAAPVVEELVFRGWIFTNLRARFRFWPSNIVAGALFAIAHWEHTHLYALAIFPLGLLLGLAREQTGSIKASATFHGIYNGLALTIALFAGV